MTARVVMVTAAFALAAVGATAQPAPPVDQARLAAIVRSYGASGAFMGSVLVIKDGRVLLDTGMGKANLDWDIPNAPDVKFRIGSVTKQFTAALILLLQQDGKLSIDDPIGKYLADVPAAWSKITLSQVLHHVSGIPNFTDDPKFSAWSANPRTPKETFDLVRDKPLDFTPGSKYAYSNTNYEILGAIIETAGGASYGEQLSKRLLDPLGLRNTGLDKDDLILQHRALGYTRETGGVVYAHSESLAVPWAAGSMYSTTGDLARWSSALLSGKVLKPASLKLMTTPGLGDYAMGLTVARHAGELSIWHNGGIEGFHAYVGNFPQHGITVVVLANLDTAPSERIGVSLVDVVEGRTVILPEERKGVAISPVSLVPFVGKFNLKGQPAPTKFEIDGDHLVFGQNRRTLTYLGLRRGHPLFWDAARDMEVEFIPDQANAISEVSIDAGVETVVGKRALAP